jgi:thiosulfate reductase cytochrome b subunit
MKQSTKRSILRWIHLVLGIPILGYVYSPFENLPQYAGPTRFVFLPLLILTGLWMWQGPAVRRLFSKGTAATVATASTTTRDA